MRSFLAQALDRFVIAEATRSVPSTAEPFQELDRARALLEDADFSCSFIKEPPEIEFDSATCFRFPSHFSSRWPENDVVHGKFMRSGDGRGRPTVLLLHGWNGELGYRYLFPYLGRRLCAFGINAMMIELPYHGKRRPRHNGRSLNLISGDLLQMLQATRQTLADARSAMAWVEQETGRPPALWGFSMGGWLAGLLACSSCPTDAAVLFTPITRMDRAIAELPFCRAIQDCIRGQPLTLERVNLTEHQPWIDPRRILFVGSRYDLFAPLETVEECWQQWRGSELWRVRHGHISVLMSLIIMERVVRWLARELNRDRT